MKYAILICARNEEKVISNVINTIKNQDYPQDCYTVFVIAHNCTDGTASVAKQCGATVFEINNPSEKKKGDALNHSINKILTERKGEFDAFCFFDADNILERDFLTELNYSLVSGADGTQGFRDSTNAHKNFISEMFAVYWFVMSRIYHASRDKMNISCVLQGTGFAVKTAVLEEGWNTKSVAEDTEFTIQQVLRGKKFRYTPSAVFYDEQPVSIKMWLRQMSRWAFGVKQNMAYFPKIMKSIFNGNFKALDLAWNVTLLLVNGVLGVLSLIAVSFQVISHPEAFLTWVLLASQLSFIIMLIVVAALCVKASGKKIRKFLKGIFSYPLAVIMSTTLFLISLFRVSCEWKPIAHTGRSEEDSLLEYKTGK